MINNSICAADVSTGKLPVVSDLNVKLGAYVSFESGFSNQNKLLKSEKKISANKEGFAFYNDAAFYASISNEINDIEYGGKIVLVPTVKAKVIPTYNGSHVFVKGFYGRVELGSPIPVAANMMISDGGIPIKYIKTSTAHLKQSKKLNSSFFTSDGCFIGDDLTADLDSAPYSSEPPRTINYYTPKFEISDASKVQIGVSYTPDTANTGIGSPSEKSDGVNKRTIGKDGVDRFEIDKSVKDAITTGIVFEQKLKEDIGLKLALTGEYGNSTGKAKKFISKEDTEPKEYKLGDLRSFNIGAELEVNDFTYNACYGSWGKSFTTPELHKAGRDSYYYSVGAAYKYNATTTKLTYFASERFKNKANAIKLNITYLLAKGFKPYAEVSSYILKGKPEFYNELKSRTTKGTVFLLGVKFTL
jgi:Gram-negative porin